MSNDRLDSEGILCDGYGIVPKLVMRDKNLTPEAKAIYAYMCSLAGAGKTAFPSVELMCAELCMTRERFYKHRKLLVAFGYITIFQEKEKGKMKRNIYTLAHFPKRVEELLQQIQNIEPQSENPTAENPTTDKPQSENPTADIPTAENPTSNINSLNINNLNNNNLKNNKEKVPTSPKVDTKRIAEQFDTLWTLYPKGRKQGKEVAKKAFIKAIKDGVEYDTIKTALLAYNKQIEIHKTDTQFIKMGSTWFNQKCWEDEYETNAPSNNGYYGSRGALI